MKALRPLIAMAALAVLITSCGGDETAPTMAAMTTLAPVETVAPTSSTTTTTTTTTVPPTTSTTTVPLPMSPLNGLGVEDEDALDRRIIAVKIDNHWNARPQTGIEQADAVYELLVEGGLTRFIALYHHSDAEYLGPIRSGRPTDPTLVKFLDAPLQISGAQSWVVGVILSYDVKLLGDNGNTTFRIGSRSAPHNLYGSTVSMREESDRRGFADEPPPQPIFDFGEPTAGQPGAEVVSLDWSDNPAVRWEWTGSEYIRFNGDKPHNWLSAPQDGEEQTETQLSTDTLVVLEAVRYTASSSSGEGSSVPALDTVGNGAAYLFYNGLVVEGTWQRSSAGDRFELTLADGTPITLPPGRLWISIFPSNKQVTWE